MSKPPSLALILGKPMGKPMSKAPPMEKSSKDPLMNGGMEEDGEKESPEEDKSEMESCLSDVAEAVMSKNKDAIVSTLRDLVDCIKQDDEEVDQGEEQDQEVE